MARRCAGHGRAVALVVLLAAATWLRAGARVTWFAADPDERDTITIVSDAPLEYMLTRCQQVRGSVDVDPTNVLDAPIATFELDAAKLDTGIALRNEHLRGPGWLDVDHNPTVSFALKELKSSAKTLALAPRKPLALDGVATVTLRGQSVDLPVKLTVTLLPADEETAIRLPGDLLQVHAQFDLLLSDFGIDVPEAARLLVANRQSVEARLCVSTQKPAPDPE